MIKTRKMCSMFLVCWYWSQFAAYSRSAPHAVTQFFFYKTWKMMVFTILLFATLYKQRYSWKVRIQTKKTNLRLNRIFEVIIWNHYWQKWLVISIFFNLWRLVISQFHSIIGLSWSLIVDPRLVILTSLLKSRD